MTFLIVSDRDELKIKLCERAGITLIEVPYWWDLSEAALRATLANIRPELNIVVPQGAVAITAKPREVAR